MQSQTQKTERSPSPWWNRPVVHWQPNQVVITFHSPVPHTVGIEKVTASLNLDPLNQFLATHNFQLKPLMLKDVPHSDDPSLHEIVQIEEELEQLETEVIAWERLTPHRTPFTGLATGNDQPYKTPGEREIEDLKARIAALEQERERRLQTIRSGGKHGTNSKKDKQQLPERTLNSSAGKYLFPHPASPGSLTVCLFNCINPSLASSSSKHAGGMAPDTTQAVVKLINQNLDKLQQDGQIQVVAATPNWISGGAPSIGESCPATVPIPVSEDQASKPWHLKLPELSKPLQDLKGDDVTIFVLDTIPTAHHIKQRAKALASKNPLLQSVVSAMSGNSPSIVINHQQLPSRLGSDIQTGKDIFGRHIGFNMVDHGLFVTGILHDLVPNAKIEVIRVLNDHGVGDLGMICEALSTIQQRMLAGNPGQVVINLSMVIVAPDAMLPGLWFGNDSSQPAGLAAMMQEIHHLHTGIHLLIKSLAAQGAVIVASSGNESDANNFHGMNAGVSNRFGPRRPAAFPEVIGVGAVNKQGQATSYSDYPALPPNHNGVATYGGDLAKPVPPATATEPTPPGARTWAVVDDAMIGLYSSSHYPMLSATDSPPVDYPAPKGSNGLAYWSGTSFATPIVSALAASILQAQKQGLLSPTLSVQDLITTAAGQQKLTASGTSFSNNTGFGLGVGLLKAEQTGS